MQRMISDLRDLTKSFMSLSGAASMFGVSQLGRLLDVRTPRASADEVSRRLDSVTEAMTDQLAGRLSSTFARTDILQRGLVDFIADIVTLNPSGVLAFSAPVLAPVLNPVASALDPLVSALDRALPGTEAEVRWLELRNKIEIYLFVPNAASRLQISPVERIPLPTLVERAYALGPFLALWAVEGLGHVYGLQALQDTPAPRGLLTGPEAEASRPGALLMLHSGIGLAFAQSLLAPVTPHNAAALLPPALRRFVVLCRENSRPENFQAAYESLGLVAQAFHSNLVAIIDRELQQSADDLLGYFWHGVGRAIYFAPRYFLPFADIDWVATPQLAPHEIGRLKITAGLAWAVTLVNMRQPAVMERLLRRDAEVLPRTPAFSTAVASSVVMRYDTTPDAPFIPAFVEHRPDASGPGLVRAWEALIRGPVVSAQQDHYSRRFFVSAPGCYGTPSTWTGERKGVGHPSWEDKPRCRERPPTCATWRNRS